MHKFALSLAALSLGALVAPAFAADMIPYQHPGHVAPSTTVLSTGTMLQLYFYGSSAANDDQIEVKDVTQGWTSGLILDNHSSSAGDKYTFPTGTDKLAVNDVLEFFLVDKDTGKTYSSIAGDSDDGYNHAYITSFSGNGTIPAGTFVGFEDLFIGANSDGFCSGEKNKSDCDYNDDEFVFVALNPAPTPEPNSLALLGTSILGAAAIARRRFFGR